MVSNYTIHENIFIIFIFFLISDKSDEIACLTNSYKTRKFLNSNILSFLATNDFVITIFLRGFHIETTQIYIFILIHTIL